MNRRVYVSAEIFDGESLHQDKALLVEGDVIRGICAVDDLPPGYDGVEMAGGTIMPGFVDLQVNGGGGVMFNDDTSLDGLVTIAEAHVPRNPEKWSADVFDETFKYLLGAK